MSMNLKCQFNQGLDIRLVDDENSKLLSKLNYLHEYIFAFDDIKLAAMIECKLEIMSWRKPWQFKFFVYIHPDMHLSDTVKRIVWLKEHQILPYIMRDIACWNSAYNQFYVDLAGYCNQVFAFKSLDFEQFLNRRHKTKSRINQSAKLWNENL